MSHPAPPKPPAKPAAKAPSKPVAPAAPDGATEEMDTVDADTLQAAIQATDTIEADDPDAAAAIRKLCMAVATDLGLGEAIPENWNTDGTVGDPEPAE